jgi:hypothetical protein
VALAALGPIFERLFSAQPGSSRASERGRLTEPTPAVQSRRRGRLNMPLHSHWRGRRPSAGLSRPTDIGGGPSHGGLRRRETRMSRWQQFLLSSAFRLSIVSVSQPWRKRMSGIAGRMVALRQLRYAALVAVIIPGALVAGCVAPPPPPPPPQPIHAPPPPPPPLPVVRG